VKEADRNKKVARGAGWPAAASRRRIAAIDPELPVALYESGRSRTSLSGQELALHSASNGRNSKVIAPDPLTEIVVHPRPAIIRLVSSGY
jgi:hypothetical protein